MSTSEKLTPAEVAEVKKRVTPIIAKTTTQGLKAWLKTRGLRSSATTKEDLANRVTKLITDGELKEDLLEEALIGFEEASGKRIYLFDLNESPQGSVTAWLPKRLTELSIPQPSARQLSGKRSKPMTAIYSTFENNVLRIKWSEVQTEAKLDPQTDEPITNPVEKQIIFIADFGKKVVELRLDPPENRHSWFQTPNTLDQQTLSQDQRQTVVSFNVAPSMLHTFGSSAFNQTNLWVREDKIRYWPSADPLADTPATLAQARRLTNAGLRNEFTYSHGRHTLVAGAEWKHTFLSEQFITGLTDPAYNSPCLGPDGAPSPDTNYSDPSQCGPAGLAVNPGFLPGLLKIDLTRGGTLFNFRGYTDIKQEAVFAQDSIRLGNFTLNPGLRFDNYNGLTNSNAFQPRVGGAYTALPLHTVFHLAYSRVFLTPYNENLIVASSSGPGSTAGALGAVDSALLKTGRRNQFNVGFETQLTKLLSFSGEYLWKFTYGAYDFDVLLNSPLTFPTQFRKSKIDGALFRATIAPTHGFAGYLTVSHVRSRLFGPETGGVSFSPPYSNVARPDHDEGLAMNFYARYQIGRRGPWAGISYRYDGGLVAVAVPDYATALRLTGDEQGQMGLHCGATFASASHPIRSCVSSLGATRIRIPPAGTENDDKNPPRIAVRSTVDLSIGQDDLFLHEKQSLGFRFDVVNLANVDGLYNFLSTFSGTHFISPRSVTGQIRYTF